MMKPSASAPFTKAPRWGAFVSSGKDALPEGPCSRRLHGKGAAPKACTTLPDMPHMHYSYIQLYISKCTKVLVIL